ncbi:MAG: hydantoinase/oxoprolinase family protein [Methylococcales bacterium]
MGPEVILGWDIGGAHVKVAVLDRNNALDVTQHPCPLWRGISGLEEVVDRILLRLASRLVCHAVSMTGELADLFSGRDAGVRQILDVLGARIDPDSLYIFAGRAGMLAFADLNPGHYSSIASANWLASAAFVASAVDSAVFIDIGSTTTDILLVAAGEVRAKGFSDSERLGSGEMVYTGIVRTPIAALVKRVLFEGQCVPLMAEHFATTADVYRLTRELPEDYDQWPAADGAEKSPEASARRLARMIGRDLKSAPLASWTRLAGLCREYQLREIQNALMLQLSRPDSGHPSVIVGAGIGRFLAVDLGARIGLGYRDFASFVEHHAALPGVAECAPAVSLALLLAGQLRP